MGPCILLISSHYIVWSLGHAAGPVDEHGTGQEHPPSTSQQDMIKAAVQARSKIMFSGESGAAVASGIKDDAATAERPTYGLVRAAIEVVFKELPDALFDPHAEHRPCGVLDRYEPSACSLATRSGCRCCRSGRTRSTQAPTRKSATRRLRMRRCNVCYECDITTHV